MLKLYTAKNSVLTDALCRLVGRYLAQEDRTLYVIVPRQLTLLTERTIIDRLHLQGSFRLQVLSTARFCMRVFNATGDPECVRIDDRGRVMLVRRLMIEHVNELSVYRGFQRRHGFCERAAAQLELFIQGGMTGDLLRECAAEDEGLTAKKLTDLAVLLDAYAQCMSERFKDGETDLIRAADQLTDAFTAENRFIFFGFDLMPPTLQRLIAKLAAAGDTDLFLPLPGTENGCCLPLKNSIDRLSALCRENGTFIERTTLDETVADRAEDLGKLEARMFAFETHEAEQAEHIHIVEARDPREECMYIAAVCRENAMRGMRWSDMQLLCADPDTYGHILTECFSLYGVPLFISEARPVSRMATAECLLSALRLIERGWHTEDVLTLIRTGYTGISRSDGDRLANYAVQRGIDLFKWKREFTKGDEKQLEQLNAAREKLTAPVLRMERALRRAKTLKAQLTALYGYLEDIGALNHSRGLQLRLAEKELREEADRLSQAWNRIIGALDQMAELMGEEPLELAELSRTLSDSLEASAVKVLPQSADAVSAQGLNRLLHQHAKLLFFVGMTDSGSPAGKDLLTDRQKQTVAQQTKVYLGPTEADNALLQRFYLKSALGMADEQVYFTWPISGTDDSAKRPSMTVRMVGELFRNITICPGSNADAQLLMRSAPGAAAVLTAYAAAELREGRQPDAADTAALSAMRTAAQAMPAIADALDRIESTAWQRADGIDVETAHALYGGRDRISVTLLETFARCPFAFFVQTGLHPERIEAPELKKSDIGSFLHDAMRGFLQAYGTQLNDMSGDRAADLMEALARDLLAQTDHGDAATLPAEHDAMLENARACARALAVQMAGSTFRTDLLEHGFGPDDPERSIRLGDTLLEGRIDRIDTSTEPEALRVIDYKLSGKKLDPTDLYGGLAMQLPIYLSVAQTQNGGANAGMYYFPLSDGIVTTRSENPIEIEKERAKLFQLSGLLPDDESLIKAMTPNVEEVFGKILTKDGIFTKKVLRASVPDYQRLLRHTLRLAQQQIDAIRGGETAVAPAKVGAGNSDRTGCDYCKYRASCLIDSRTDGHRYRRIRSVKWDELFMKLIEEENELSKKEAEQTKSE